MEYFFDSYVMRRDFFDSVKVIVVVLVVGNCCSEKKKREIDGVEKRLVVRW